MASLNFSTVYILATVDAPVTTNAGLPAEISDDDDLLTAPNGSGVDVFSAIIAPGTGGATEIMPSYLGTNANGDVFGEFTVPNGPTTVFLFSNAAYSFGQTPPPVMARNFDICFTAGTRIATPDGTCFVEDLVEGDLVFTRSEGPQPVQWVGRRHLSSTQLRMEPSRRPVRFDTGAIGNTAPLLVSPQHRLLVTGTRAEVLLGASEMLVAAADLVNGDTIVRVSPPGGVTYLHVIVETHGLLQSNGCWSESLNPDTTAMSTLDPDAQAEIQGLFPDLFAGAVPMPTRPVARAAEGRFLA